MNRMFSRALICKLLFIVLLFGSSDSNLFDQAPARRSLLSFPDTHDTALVATLDGTINLVYRDSGRIIWSFASGPPIYSSYQAPINHDDDKENASSSSSSSGGSYYIDCGDDWKLFAHTDLGKQAMDMSMEEFIRIMPHVSEDGGVILGSKKTTAFVVDANSGRIIRVHHSSPDTAHTPVINATSDSIIRKTIKKHEKPDKQLSFTRTDYVLTTFAPNSDKVLWNVTVADIDVALLCQENANSIAGPSMSPRIDIGSKSHDKFNMPLSCQSKAVVHRLRIPRDMDAFQISGKQSEPKAPILILPPNEPLLPNSEKSRKYSRDNDFETQTVFSLPSVEPGLEIPGPQDVKKHVVSERRIAFVIISALIIVIGFLMYRHHILTSVTLNKNAKSSSSRKKRHRKSGKSYGNEDGNGNAEGDVEKSLLKFNDLVECDMEGRTIGKLFVSSNEIAKGSNGTVVLEGMYEGRKNVGPTKTRMMDDVMHGVRLWRSNGYPSPILLKLMRDIVAGLVHLHELGIIHRDLKPHNVLIVKEKVLCGKLSDMGISRRLVGDMSSLGHHATGSGSSGWQAPEQLLLGRQTRAVDLFSLGCVLFFCITCGRHPFGDHLERDVNVAKNRVNLFLVEHIPEAVNLFSQLLNPNAELRPKASEVLHHPLFWNSEIRVSFLRDTSDRVELEDREVNSIILGALESKGSIALGGKWDEKMEPAFIANIGRYRRYKYNSVRDLLRVIRNKLSHYRELPYEIQELLGSIPEGFDVYFASRFPRLLMEVYIVMYHYCKEEEWFHKYLG
ncbi:putative protein kinase IRE1 family [Helianthus annuus]|nr:putative protein kinase IRE1 family [Helianthus annuus]